MSEKVIIMSVEALTGLAEGRPARSRRTCRQNPCEDAKTKIADHHHSLQPRSQKGQLISKMTFKDEHRTSGSGRRTSALAVSFGMALFIVGFAVTLASLPSDTAAGTKGSGSLDEAVDSLQSRGDGMLLAIGLVVSMAGVIVATAVPAAVFLQGAKREA